MTTETTVATTSIETLVDLAKALTVSHSEQEHYKQQFQTTSGAFAFAIFTANTEGLDISGLSERIGKDLWKRVKGPVSKGNKVWHYLSAGNGVSIETEEIDIDRVTIDMVLDKQVTISTVYTAIKKAEKLAATQHDISLNLATSEMQAYLESDMVRDEHKGIPTDALVAQLALNNPEVYSACRSTGRDCIATKQAEQTTVDTENTIQDAINMLKQAGYKVTKSNK